MACPNCTDGFCKDCLIARCCVKPKPPIWKLKPPPEKREPGEKRKSKPPSATVLAKREAVKQLVWDKTLNHGTRSCWAYRKCKCGPCRKANSDYIRERNHRLKAKAGKMTTRKGDSNG